MSGAKDSQGPDPREKLAIHIRTDIRSIFTHNQTAPTVVFSIGLDIHMIYNILVVIL